MNEALLVFIVMFGILAAASVAFRNDTAKMAPMMVLCAIVGALIAGFGIPLRELVEGMSGYLDAGMYALMGALFVAVLSHNGAFEWVLGKIAAGKSPLAKTFLLLLLVALPGMISGMAIVCLMTSGLLVGRWLLEHGTDKKTAVGFVATGSVLGMLAPPFNLVAMMLMETTGTGFGGASLPLLALALPAYVVYSIFVSKKLKFPDAAAQPAEKGNARCVVPLLIVLALYLWYDLLKAVLPFLGLPLIALIGLILAIFLPNKKFKPLSAIGDMLSSIAPFIAIVFAAGTFQEIIAMTGARGWMVTALSPMAGPLAAALGVAAVLLAGVFAGGAPSLSLAVLLAYCNKGYGVLLALCVAWALGALLSRRNGLFGRAAMLLDVTEDGNRVLRPVLMPSAALAAMAIVFLLASAALSSLRL